MSSSNVSPLPEVAGYDIISHLGKGGMADVYLANDVRLERKVAIKLLPLDSVDVDEVMLEAKSLARINHPNVVQIYDVIQLPDHVAIVMEYVSGTPLHRLPKHQTLDMLDNVDRLLQLAEGVKAIHAAGIIHSDLKPGNVIVSDSGRLKILDFGIALHVSEDEVAKATFATSHYASPEQLAGEPLSFQSDVFSFGIIAFSLLSGRHPFGENDDIRDNILSGKSLPNSALVPPLMPEFSGLLDALLQPKAQNRPASFKDVIQGLKHVRGLLVQESEMGLETAPLEPLPKKELQPQKEPRSKWLFLVAAIVLITIGLAATFYVNQSPSEEVRYVIVKVPELKNAQQGREGANVVATIDDALRQTILRQPHLRLLKENLSGLNSSEGNDLATQAGATDMISTHVDCSESGCTVTSSLQTKSTNDGVWTVANEKEWFARNETLISLYNATRDNLKWIMPSVDTSAGYVVPDDAYAIYIELYSRFWLKNEFDEQMLKTLEVLLKENPHLDSGYSLYRRLVFNLYYETQEDEYLLRAERVLKNASPEFKQGVIYAVESFILRMTLRDFEQAEQLLAIAEGRGASVSLMTELRASLYLTSGQLQNAVESYKQAALLRPSVANFYALAYSYYMLSEFSLSESYLLKVRALDEGHTSATELLANIYLIQENISSSIDMYLSLIDLTPHSNYLSNLSIAYMLDGKYEKAREYAQWAVDKSPENIYWLLNHADVELLSGNPETARSLYLKVLQTVSVDDVASLFIAAQANAHLGNYQQAIEQVNLGLSRAPESGENAYNAAIVYALAGENISAVTQIKVSMSADFSPLWFTLPWFEGLCDYSEFKGLFENKAHEEKGDYFRLVCP